MVQPTSNEQQGGQHIARETVLIVEDDLTISDLVYQALTDEGYAATILNAPTQDALRVAIGRLEPDCILLDGPGRGDYGRSWLDAAWIHARGRPVPVIMFSADARATREAQEGKSQRSQHAGFYSVLPKPFNLDTLLDAVAAAVGSIDRFNRSVQAEAIRTAEMVTKLEASGVRDVRPSTRREWTSFFTGDQLCMLYWSQRDGVYYVLRQAADSGSMEQVGRVHDLDTAIAVAIAPTG